MRSLIVRIGFVLRATPGLIGTAWAEPQAPAAEHAPAASAAADDAPSEAASEPAESAATALFEKARALFEQGDYAAACPVFEQSLERMPGVGTKFQLASCFEKLGKKARAHALFLEVAQVTLEAGQVERHEVAQGRALALESELGALRLEIEDDPASLSVLVDDELVSATQLAAQFFVDPGKHRVRAQAPDKVEWSREVTVDATKLVTVQIPALKAPEPKPKPEPKPEPEPEPAATPLDQAPAQEAAYTWVPPVALGVGAVGLFAGLAFTQQYRSSNEDAKQVCPSSYACSPEEIERHADLIDDARTARTRAYIGYGVAFAGLAGGAIYYIIRPKRPSESTLPNLRLEPVVGTDSVGGVAYGSF